jgi:RNA polymerase sigma factor (TIGR02999 family)
MTGTPEITRLLQAYRDGDNAAFARLFELVYDQLRQRAHYQLRELDGSSLATTALVHEVYLKLAGAGDPDWENRRHFFRVAGRAMRQVVIDRARRYSAAKRGGPRVALDIDSVSIPVENAPDQLIALDEALTRLEAESPRAAQVIELTYFAGLSVEDAADVLKISTRGVKRMRQFGRAWLYRDLAPGSVDTASTSAASREAGKAGRNDAGR